MDSLVLKSYDNLRLNPLQLLWFSYSNFLNLVGLLIVSTKYYFVVHWNDLHMEISLRKLTLNYSLSVIDIMRYAEISNLK